MKRKKKKGRERERIVHVYEGSVEGTRCQTVVFTLATISRNTLSRNDKSVIFRIYIKDTNVKRLGVIVARNHVGWPLLRKVLTARNF